MNAKGLTMRVRWKPFYIEGDDEAHNMPDTVIHDVRECSVIRGDICVVRENFCHTWLKTKEIQAIEWED